MEFSEHDISSVEDNVNDFVVISENIDVMNTIDLVKDDTAGAISTFMGTTRNNFEGSHWISGISWHW
jgi:molybdopterin synthase catalytic subunit